MCREKRSDVKEAYRFSLNSKNIRDFCRSMDINEMAKPCQENIFIKKEFGLF